MKIRNHFRISKKSALSIAVALFAVAGLSCNKFTQISPSNALSTGTIFTDSTKIELAINGMYWQATMGTYAGGVGRLYPFGAASIEQSEMRGEDMVNLASFYAITYQSTISPTSPNNVYMWNNLYELINQANVVIAGVQGAIQSGVVTQNSGDSYIGEALFLRALAHHELLLNFCRPYADNKGNNPGVPYRTIAITGSDAIQQGLQVDRGTVAEDYAQILGDLDTAELYLPETQTNGFARATKGAAIALKTRIKLHMQDWAGVVAEGTKLGTDGSAPFISPVGGYKLEADPATPFTSFSKNSESIFSIGNSSNNYNVNGSLAAILGPAGGGGRSLVAISPNLYNAPYWVDGDKRRIELTIQDAASPHLYFTYKYRDYATMDDWAPIIRYAEVLLNVAEAEARLGNNSQAFALLNAVRNRSVPDTAQYTTQPADLILAILQERRIEFSAEGRRWADIHRLALDPQYGLGNGIGVPEKLDPSDFTSASYGVGLPLITPITIINPAIPYSDKRFLWPIPTSELTANPTLANEQNPGY
jgi:hypothetical protein